MLHNFDDDDIITFFDTEHYPDELVDAAEPFASLAQDIAESYPPSLQRNMALYNLLLAKDAAVRCQVSVLRKSQNNE